MNAFLLFILIFVLNKVSDVLWLITVNIVLYINFGISLTACPQLVISVIFNCLLLFV